MTDFVAYPSRWRIAVLIMAAGGFVVLGLWMVGTFGPPPSTRRYPAVVAVVVGWSSIVFFGLCGLLGARKLFDTREQLRIGAAGIRSTPWSDQTLPWSEIADVTTWEFSGQITIVLHLRNPARFPPKRSFGALAAANRKLTGGHVSLSLAGTDRSVADALSAIRQFRPISVRR